MSEAPQAGPAGSTHSESDLDTQPSDDLHITSVGGDNGVDGPDGSDGGEPSGDEKVSIASESTAEDLGGVVEGQDVSGQDPDSAPLTRDEAEFRADTTQFAGEEDTEFAAAEVPTNPDSAGDDSEAVVPDTPEVAQALERALPQVSADLQNALPKGVSVQDVIDSVTALGPEATVTDLKEALPEGVEVKELKAALPEDWAVSFNGNNFGQGSATANADIGLAVSIGANTQSSADGAFDDAFAFANNTVDEHTVAEAIGGQRNLAVAAGTNDTAEIDDQAGEASDNTAVAIGANNEADIRFGGSNNTVVIDGGTDNTAELGDVVQIGILNLPNGVVFPIEASQPAGDGNTIIMNGGTGNRATVNLQSDKNTVTFNGGVGNSADLLLASGNTFTFNDGSGNRVTSRGDANKVADGGTTDHNIVTFDSGTGGWAQLSGHASDNTIDFNQPDGGVSTGENNHIWIRGTSQGNTVHVNDSQDSDATIRNSNKNTAEFLRSKQGTINVTGDKDSGLKNNLFVGNRAEGSLATNNTITIENGSTLGGHTRASSRNTVAVGNGDGNSVKITGNSDNMVGAGDNLGMLSEPNGGNRNSITINGNTNLLSTIPQANGNDIVRSGVSDQTVFVSSSDKVLDINGFTGVIVDP